MKRICLSIDLEVDWGRGNTFSSHYELKKLLELLDEYNVKATFFVSTETLGSGLTSSDIKMIFEKGHEVGSHGHNHRRNSFLSEKELEKDIETSKKILESITGENILGYRSPYLSSHKEIDNVLKKNEILYNSSNGSIWPSYKNILSTMLIRNKFTVPVSNFLYVLPLSLTYIRLLSPVLKYIPIGSGAMFMHLHEFKKENDTSLLGRILSINSGEKAFDILRRFIEMHSKKVKYIRCCDYHDNKGIAL